MVSSYVASVEQAWDDHGATYDYTLVSAPTALGAHANAYVSPSASIYGRVGHMPSSQPHCAASVGGGAG